jgi:FAD/FMN-containing dehydrogenase
MLRGVTIDPVARTARAEAGTIWIEVVQAAAEHGLAALAGSSPDVGVVGYTLGGGLSWLARKHGIGANQVVAVEMVTADGEFRRVDRENDPDLFWPRAAAMHARSGRRPPTIDSAASRRHTTRAT